MNEESVEAVGYPLQGLSPKDRLAIHSLGIPHDEFGLSSGAVIYERHKVTIIFRLSVVPFVKEYFSGTFGITKINSADHHLFFEIVLNNCLEVAVVLADLCFGDDALKTH